MPKKVTLRKFTVRNGELFDEVVSREKFAWIPWKINGEWIWRDCYYKVTTYIEPYDLDPAGPLGQSVHQYFNKKDYLIYLIKEGYNND